MSPTPTMNSTAFVAATPMLARPSSALSTSSFISRRMSVVPARRSATIMMSEKENIPQGFTVFSETLNGRAAMFGFALAVITEAITGKGIIGQLAALGDFSAVTNALGL
eukprot:TRINITY_DN1099_c0_g3_i1.p2 TRINITY_DN1099_c0_g3~~TRINITY_DN1099_c0_g3_i1.p2  ORF type:complete len:109 (+),score=25.60 TRINITY_DN1099_c0_g3_i1:385-711(+)